MVVVACWDVWIGVPPFVLHARTSTVRILSSKQQTNHMQKLIDVNDFYFGYLL